MIPINSLLNSTSQTPVVRYPTLPSIHVIFGTLQPMPPAAAASVSVIGSTFTSEEDALITDLFLSGLNPKEVSTKFNERFEYCEPKILKNRFKLITGITPPNSKSASWSVADMAMLKQALSEKPNFSKISQDVFQGKKTSDQIRDKYNRTLNPQYDKSQLTEEEKALVLSNIKRYKEKGAILWTQMSEELFDGKRYGPVLRDFYKSHRLMQTRNCAKRKMPDPIQFHQHEQPQEPKKMAARRYSYVEETFILSGIQSGLSPAEIYNLYKQTFANPRSLVSIKSKIEQLAATLK